MLNYRNPTDLHQVPLLLQHPYSLPGCFQMCWNPARSSIWEMQLYNRQSPVVLLPEIIPTPHLLYQGISFSIQMIRLWYLLYSGSMLVRGMIRNYLCNYLKPYQRKSGPLSFWLWYEFLHPLQELLVGK